MIFMFTVFVPEHKKITCFGRIYRYWWMLVTTIVVISDAFVSIQYLQDLGTTSVSTSMHIPQSFCQAFYRFLISLTFLLLFIRVESIMNQSISRKVPFSPRAVLVAGSYSGPRHGNCSKSRID